MKLYRFNVQRYGHNIDLCYNILRNKVDSEDATDKDWEEYEKIQDVYSKMLFNSDGRFSYVPYDVWQKLNEYSMYAEAHRDYCNAIARSAN